MKLVRFAFAGAMFAGALAASTFASAAELLTVQLKDGPVVIELMPDVAPKHVAQIEALALNSWIIMTSWVRFLCTAGFSPKHAVWTLLAVSNYVVGSVLEQQASDADERISDRSDVSEQAPSSFLHGLFHELETDSMDAAFNFGLDSLIAGFERLRSCTTN